MLLNNSSLVKLKAKCKKLRETSVKKKLNVVVTKHTYITVSVKWRGVFEQNGKVHYSLVAKLVTTAPPAAHMCYS